MYHGINSEMGGRLIICNVQKRMLKTLKGNSLKKLISYSEAERMFSKVGN